MFRWILMLVLWLLLAACSSEPVPTATPTATPAPLAQISTERSDSGSLTLAYPQDWIAEEVQPGQIEIATTRDALFFLTDPMTPLGESEVVGQVSLFVDAEIEQNAGLGADASPEAVLVAIIRAFGVDSMFEGEISAQAFSAGDYPAAFSRTSFSVGESQRAVYLQLVDLEGARVFMFFSGSSAAALDQNLDAFGILAENLQFTPAPAGA